MNRIEFRRIMLGITGIELCALGCFLIAFSAVISNWVHGIAGTLLVIIGLSGVIIIMRKEEKNPSNISIYQK